MNEELIFLADLWLPEGDPVQVGKNISYSREECYKALILGASYASFTKSGTWYRFLEKQFKGFNKPRGTNWVDFWLWQSDLKRCHKCNSIKDIDSFYREPNKTNIYHRRSECKSCQPKCRDSAYKSSLYRARKSRACPDWVNLKQLAQIYADRPEDMEVDHIVPIAGKLVSGLHVPWNLQYLSREDNAMKSNKFEI